MSYKIPSHEPFSVYDEPYRYLDIVSVQEVGNTSALILFRPDPKKLERAIRKACEIARAEGVGRLLVTYAFTMEADDAADLISEGDPVGPDADGWLESIVEAVDGFVLCAWGKNASYMDRDQTLLSVLSGSDLRCVGTDRNGFPKALQGASEGLLAYEGRDIF